MRVTKTTSGPKSSAGKTPTTVTPAAEVQVRPSKRYTIKPIVHPPENEEAEKLHAALDGLIRHYRDGGAKGVPNQKLPYKDDTEMIALLKKFRLDLGYTQAEFARLFGIGLKTLQRWETDETPQVSESLKTLVQGILAAPYTIAMVVAQPGLSRALPSAMTPLDTMQRDAAAPDHDKESTRAT